jgi:hypothetical protein
VSVPPAHKVQALSLSVLSLSYKAHPLKCLYSFDVIVGYHFILNMKTWRTCGRLVYMVLDSIPIQHVAKKWLAKCGMNCNMDSVVLFVVKL